MIGKGRASCLSITCIWPVDQLNYGTAITQPTALSESRHLSSRSTSDTVTCPNDPQTDTRAVGARAAEPAQGPTTAVGA